VDTIAVYVMALGRCEEYLKGRTWSRYLRSLKLMSPRAMEPSFGIPALFLGLPCALMYGILHSVATSVKAEKSCHGLAKVSKHVTWHACRCNTSMAVIECSSLGLDMPAFSIRMAGQERGRLSNLTRTGRFNVKA
jgi:hypothetical protein